MLPVIDSTNQYLLDRLDELKSGDACAPLNISRLVVAAAGGWFSPFGANLYLSMYWRLE